MAIKIKTAKRKARAARRAGACKRCAAFEPDKAPAGRKLNTASAPCAGCSRLLSVDVDTFDRWTPEKLAAYIRAVSPHDDVCYDKLAVIKKGEPYPEQPHGPCGKAHVIIIMNAPP